MVDETTKTKEEQEAAALAEWEAMAKSDEEAKKKWLKHYI